MTREIKFRAWDTKRKEWKYFIIPAALFHPWDTDNFKSENYTHWSEYTGLRDKNGKEIYEGDIVMVDGSNEPKMMEFFVGDFVAGKIYGGADAYRMEVIGNIYENPELLTV